MKDYPSMTIKEENVMIITAKIESLNHISKTCSECKLQSDDRKCPLILDAHQSCPVTFYPELYDAATEKMEDGTTVIDVFKTGRRCLCPLEEKVLDVAAEEGEHS